MIRNKNNRSGTALVEFALTFPIIVTFFFAAFEVCRFSMLTQTIENAVFEGARRGVVPGATAEDCRAEATRILSTVAIGNATITVTPANINRNTNEVTVAIEVPYLGNTFVPLNFFRGARVQRQITMVRELER